MRQNNSAGFFKLILIIVGAIIILAWLKIDLRELLESAIAQHNLEVLKGIGEKIWSGFILLWENYLKEVVSWVWKDFVLDKIWPAISLILNPQTVK